MVVNKLIDAKNDISVTRGKMCTVPGSRCAELVLYAFL